MSEKLNQQKHLCLEICDTHYLLPLHEIKEIIGETQMTPLPNVPSYIRGLINLRGQVISIFDPGLRMGLEKTKPKPDSKRKKCIVICETTYEDKEIKLGLIVDHVLEVRSVHKDQMEKPPHSTDFGVDHKFVSHIVKGEEEEQSMTLVLKLETLISDFLRCQNAQQKQAS